MSRRPGRLSRRGGEFGDEIGILDILSEGGKIDLARVEFGGRRAKQRARIVDDTNDRHRRGLGREPFPQPERPIEPQRGFEQRHRAAVAAQVEPADDRHLETRLGKGDAERQPCRSGARDENIGSLVHALI